MKKLLISLLLLSFVSCLPLLPADSHLIKTLTATTVMDVATKTSIPPEATQTQPIQSVIQRAYDPAEWKQLYNKDMVVQLEIDSTQMVWIALSGGEVGFFDGAKWVFFSEKDYGLQGKPSDMAIAPDNSVWLAGRHALSRYRSGHWDVFPMPSVTGIVFPRLSIDQSGVVWVTTPFCNCGNKIDKFDGKNWSYILLWTTERTLDVQQLLFAPDGTLWAGDDSGEIGRYDGKIWKNYSAKDLWSTGDSIGTRIASDNHGNIFGIHTGQSWIVRIDTNGSVSKIPFYSSFDLDPMLLRLFVDRQNMIWLNACLKDQSNACLMYYKNNQWFSFTNWPFSRVTDIKELSDGTLLVATFQGLYQFKSAK